MYCFNLFSLLHIERKCGRTLYLVAGPHLADAAVGLPRRTAARHSAQLRASDIDPIVWGAGGGEVRAEQI